MKAERFRLRFHTVTETAVVAVIVLALLATSVEVVHYLGSP